jgi:hypothetical protein
MIAVEFTGTELVHKILDADGDHYRIADVEGSSRFYAATFFSERYSPSSYRV